MAYTLYTGTFEQTENTFLRLTANPYTIIAAVTKDGTEIIPIAGTTTVPTADDCTNYADNPYGVLIASYNLGKLTSATSTVNVETILFKYNVTFHYYINATTMYTFTDSYAYDTTFNLMNRPDLQYSTKFGGWAVGSQNSSVIIPVNVKKARLAEMDCVNNSGTDPVALLKIPTLYTTPSTTLDLYEIRRPCAAVSINVTVTDGSPLTTTIVVGN